MSTLEHNLALSFESKASFEPATNPIRTKIICTIGPCTASKAMLTRLVNAGMNVARLNFSHGTHEYHEGVIRNLREVLAKENRMCAIMLDTKGPEIRTGKLVDGKEIRLISGQELVLTGDYKYVGNKEKIAVSYDSLAKSVRKGSQVLIDDGLISLTVIEIDGDDVRCTVKNDGLLGETKGVNLPGAVVNLPALTDKDKADLRFGCEQKVDLVAASFIRKADDVHEIRRYLKNNNGGSIMIISKIENQEGLQNYDAVMDASDGIMVARGDMGVEIPIEKVSIAQKMMISKCNVAGKPVVTATQMLDSMIKNPRPTRAETTDVANAVFDGSDCVMLSGETAKGDYPVQAVETMASICREAEKALDYNASFNALRKHMKKNNPNQSVTETITSSAVKTAYDLSSSIILCLTETGRTARLVCKYRPVSPIVCVTSNEHTARQLLLYRGAFPMLVGSMIGTESLIARSLVRMGSSRLAKKGDLVVVVSGMTEGVSGGTNVMRVLTVQ